MHCRFPPAVAWRSLARRSIAAAALLLAGCGDDPSGPTPGTFQAQLSGVIDALLRGTSYGQMISTEIHPGGEFTFQMFDVRGDTALQITILCPGADPPVGTFVLDGSPANCQGKYNKLVNVGMDLVVLEHASSDDGSATIGAPSNRESAGRFDFSGVLMRGDQAIGRIRATGAFSADLF